MMKKLALFFKAFIDKLRIYFRLLKNLLKRFFPIYFKPKVWPNSSQGIDPDLVNFLAGFRRPVIPALVDNGNFFYLQVGHQSYCDDKTTLELTQLAMNVVPTLIKAVPGDVFATNSFKAGDGWTPYSLSTNSRRVISPLFTKKNARAYSRELMQKITSVCSTRIIDPLFYPSAEIEKKAALVKGLEEILKNFTEIELCQMTVRQEFGWRELGELKCFRVIFELKAFVDQLLTTGVPKELINEVFKPKYALFMHHKDWIHFSKNQTRSLSVALSTDLLIPNEDEALHDFLRIGFKVCLGPALTARSRNITIIAITNGIMLSSLKEKMILVLYTLSQQAALSNLESLNITIIFNEQKIQARTFNARLSEQYEAMRTFIQEKVLDGAPSTEKEAYRAAFKDDFTSNDIVMVFTDGGSCKLSSGNYAHYVAWTLQIKKFSARFYGFHLGFDGVHKINILRAIGSLANSAFIYPLITDNFSAQLEEIDFLSEELKLTIAGFDYKITNGAWCVITLPLPKGQPLSLSTLSLSYKDRRMFAKPSIVQTTKFCKKSEDIYKAQIEFVRNQLQLHDPLFPDIYVLLTAEQFASLKIVIDRALNPYLSRAVYDKVTIHLDKFKRLFEARFNRDTKELLDALKAIPLPESMLIFSDQRALDSDKKQEISSEFQQSPSLSSH
jgi:hypothetical protein